jgi:hypothetical protein
MSSSAVHFNYDGDEKLAAIVIILQKRGQPDDKLVIRPAHHSMNFDVVFTQNTIGIRSDTQIIQSELYPYVERFLSVIHYDLQRCDYVQIDIPGYTAAILDSTQIGSYMNTLYYQLQSLYNCWPYEVLATRVNRDAAVIAAPVAVRAAVAAPAPEPEPEPVRAPARASVRASAVTSAATQTEERPKRVTRSMAQRTAH